MGFIKIFKNSLLILVFQRFLNISFYEFVKELDEISKEYKEEFLYLKYTLLKNLRLPYDTDFFKKKQTFFQSE